MIFFHAGVTWHARPRGRATRTRAACLRGAFLYLYYYYYIYNKRGLQPSLDGKGLNPLKPSGLLNPTVSYNILRVGLIHTSYLFQVTWREEERQIDGARRSHASIA